jgi:hypothetical protein
MFTIEIVCEAGKILNIDGQERLIYSNKNHQRLKQEFKINNKIQEDIINILKKKNDFPLRVPLTYLIEYKGYTILAKLMPDLRPIKIEKVVKYLKSLPELKAIDLHEYKEFTDQTLNLIMI